MCLQITINDNTNCEIIWRQYVQVPTRNMRYLGGNVNNSYPGFWPDSKFNGANMGPTWVLSAPDGPHVGPMNLAIRVIAYTSPCDVCTQFAFFCVLYRIITIGFSWFSSRLIQWPCNIAPVASSHDGYGCIDHNDQISNKQLEIQWLCYKL